MSGVHEALHYKKIEHGRVRCDLCPHHCAIADGGTGLCGVRANRGGVLWTDSYGRTVATAVDPIEKKPLYHFMPGSTILSIGPNGCTLSCENCQNWHISKERAPTRYIAPEELAELAGRGGSIGVAFTYTEPLLLFEYIRDVSPLLRARGLKSVLVTNGFLNEGPAREIAAIVDAMNVDLKSMSDDFYKMICGGRVEPVKRFIEIASHLTHVEVTNLVVTGLNDKDADFESLAEWLAGVSPEIPLHFSRFFPQFRMGDREPTPPARLRRAYDIASKRLHYVYLGNIFIDGTEDTRCPACGGTVVRRIGYETRVEGNGGRCPKCGAEVRGVWI